MGALGIGGLEYVTFGWIYQIALVWGAVLNSGGNIKTVSLGADHMLEVNELLPTLQLKKSGFVSKNLHFDCMALFSALSQGLQHPARGSWAMSQLCHVPP